MLLALRLLYDGFSGTAPVTPQKPVVTSSATERISGAGAPATKRLTLGSVVATESFVGSAAGSLRHLTCSSAATSFFVMGVGGLRFSSPSVACAGNEAIQGSAVCSNHFPVLAHGAETFIGGGTVTGLRLASTGSEREVFSAAGTLHTRAFTVVGAATETFSGAAHPTTFFAATGAGREAFIGVAAPTSRLVATQTERSNIVVSFVDRGCYVSVLVNPAFSSTLAQPTFEGRLVGPC